MRSRQVTAVTALVAAIAGCGSAADPPAIAHTRAHSHGRANCTRYAAPSGSARAPGSRAKPLRTPQELANRLKPGQTGCLRGGSYPAHGPNGYVLRFNHGGARGRRITIRSAPGEQARLNGVVYVPKGSNDVSVSHLVVDDSTPSQLTMQVTARRTRLSHLEVTNHSTKTCLILGNKSYGPAVRTVVTDSWFHDCGTPAHGILDHSIYVSRSRHARITGNLFVHSAAYEVQLYPNARRTLVRGNVMVDNGTGGIIVAGQGGLASSHNRITHNVISDSHKDYDIATYWGGRVGHGNVADHNCLSGGSPGSVEHGHGLRARGNLTADPGFENPGAGDFRLSSGSACFKVLPRTIAHAALDRG